MPFLASPILNPILSYIASKVAQFLVEKTELRIFFAYTDFRVDKQGREFLSIANRYHTLEGEEKKREEAKLIDAFRDLVKLR